MQNQMKQAFADKEKLRQEHQRKLGALENDLTQVTKQRDVALMNIQQI